MFRLYIENQSIVFQPIVLRFTAQQTINVFGLKNNRTLGETILHPRYQKLQPSVFADYSAYLNTPLGQFLLNLKAHHNPFYRAFLNPYGDATFCTFQIDDAIIRNKKGLYAYVIDDTIRYLGRCRDSFGKRINQGYGHIHPKNCYRDGQATNCHLNALIARYQTHVTFHVFPMTDNEEISRLEKALIQTYAPDWNIALKPYAHDMRIASEQAHATDQFDR